MLISAACLVGLAVHGSVIALEGSLITPQEAALPAQKGAVASQDRGILRGPKIVVPELQTDPQLSPIHLLVKFQSYGGSSVDLDTLRVTYLKSPVVDLTARVRPFAHPTGIDMPDAQVPPGDHLLRVDIKDTEGRVASRSFLLKIAQ